jgi:hypothetical protein
MKSNSKKKEFNPEDYKAFLAGLKSGLGLTRSASLMLLSPKLVSEILLDNPAVFKECQEGVKYAAKILLVLSGQYLGEQNLGKWKENNEYVKSFISDIFLWECYSSKKNTTPLIAAEAYLMTNDIDEAATACGFTSMEFKQYIIRNPKYQMYVNAIKGTPNNK